MDIPGYCGDLEELQPGTMLVDAAGLLGDERFWPAFLLNVGAADSALSVFGVDSADIEPFMEVLAHPLRWPVISLGLTEGHRLHVVFRNFVEDAGVDYVLQPTDGSQAIVLAALEGHFQGPALAWHELIAMSEHPDPRLSSAERLLLLLPACADLKAPASASARVADALAAVGARGALEAVAAELLEGGYWPPSSWAVVDDALVSDSPYAIRRPNGSISADSLRLVTQAFRPGQP